MQGPHAVGSISSPNQILCGDVRAQLRTIESDTIDCVVTSPPYWALRSYGSQLQVYGGKKNCHHEWGELGGPIGNVPGNMGPSGSSRLSNSERHHATPRATSTGQDCRHCTAWQGELGSEPIPFCWSMKCGRCYTCHMVEVFREVRRVMAPHATLWLNLGDTYAANRSYQVDGHYRPGSQPPRASRVPHGLKPKDMVGIPWHVAFALQRDGWWLRMDNVWANGMSFAPVAGTAMPESVKDRPNKSHEYMFLLSKSRSYYFDLDATREPFSTNPYERESRALDYDGSRWFGEPVRDPLSGIGPKQAATPPKSGVRANSDLARYRNKTAQNPDPREGARRQAPEPCEPNAYHPLGRTIRSVWAINTEPLRDSHFAAYPTKLVEPCIQMGSSEGGSCRRCGVPFQRSESPKWGTACDCGVPSRPARVLDPFAGSGTTGLVAARLGRNFTLIELNPSYVEIIRKRIAEALTPLETFKEERNE